MVDVAGGDKDAAAVMEGFLFLFAFLGQEIMFERYSWTAEDVEGDDPVDKETGWRLAIAVSFSSLIDARNSAHKSTYLSTRTIKEYNWVKFGRKA